MRRRRDKRLFRIGIGPRKRTRFLSFKNQQTIRKQSGSVQLVPDGRSHRA